MEKINALGRIDRLSKTLRENLAKRKEQVKARQQKMLENENDIEKNVEPHNVDEEI
jgi:hypothetical protein